MSDKTPDETADLPAPAPEHDLISDGSEVSDVASAVTGVAAIQQALKTMPFSPGVYRMIGAKGEVLYVGKARALKKRVTSYTQLPRLPERLRRMVSETVSMEVVTTHTEAEALLLEANYIKRMKPRFNILLRDDKSYPWLVLTEQHPFPQIAKHRGKMEKGAGYFGPFASAWAVNQTVNILQRVFLLRTCSDSVFASRTRPCLLHQIKRCSAPCVDRISREDYGHLVKQARDFLEGRDQALKGEFAAEMERAAEGLDFERAAVLRDRIRALAQMQDSNVVNPASIRDGDVIAVWQHAGQACIQVFFIRGGRNNGNRAFYPAHTRDEGRADILTAFMTQFYDDKPPPPLVLVNHGLPEASLLSEALSIRRGHKVEILHPQRGERREVVEHAETNAREALERKLAESAGQAKLLEGVARVFGLDVPPARIEVYDNSHIMGSHPYGVMIVGGPEGFDRRSYRKYGIKGAITPGDDFAMMREVLERRFGRTLREADAQGIEGRPPDWPDLLLIDGGAGQYSAVKEVLDGLGVTDVKLVGIAKGPDRDAGREWFYTGEAPPFQLEPRDPVLYYLQRLRDEAHRFAITTHRAGRSKTLVKSELDEISGIGPARKRALLNRFGSARGVGQAGLNELEAAPGINRETARRIYGHFHPDWLSG
ncbi:excinuclease ABC subunit UvrC [Acetobacter oeni]|uniref:UvrABC system protein C n=1 Tax=Acetobacter oeni TaxID=304077 RepID=A0A511XI64_9PROT|nr:excinuclease ABC subunit UvrC [Acetobacter oeni]MBB3883029.1 excinuclease ABC subunit C [Acetobacter oeni]NHO19105.1 excinuclease ABC subunit UvrC [Acetobacter oeni]GBR11610.1 excinuclease ABC subunit C [Acetobacter oeni LMG 21952]GEN62614.1 UvrABC system protein C [Acetobacter oeni]